MAVAKQNIAIVTTPNFLGLGLAAMGSENFLLSTTLNNGSVILATTNGLKPTFGEGEGERAEDDGEGDGGEDGRQNAGSDGDGRGDDGRDEPGSPTAKAKRNGRYGSPKIKSK
jgi:hypothetical protein